MKKILTVLAIVLFTINAGAQVAKTVSKEKKCCVQTEAHAKTMTAAEIATCKATCKAEGKVCTAEKMAQCTNEAHAKTMTAAEIATCKAKCKAEGKICKTGDMASCKMKSEKACCAKKA